MKEYSVWVEGYSATGGHAPAQYLGVQTAETFKDAVIQALRANKWEMKYFNEEQLTFWGCKFYDNEAKARANFG